MIDQMNGSDVLLTETLFRRARIIDFVWSENIKERENKPAGGGRLTWVEHFTLAGFTRAASSLMMCPLLLDFVRGEGERVSQLQEALRQARNEKDHHHTDAKKGDRKGE